MHGESNTWFNLVSDRRTSVNAQYVGLNSQLNIIDEIAIRTVDRQGSCVEIGVSIESGCSATVNGIETGRYARNGIDVRVSLSSRRVRVSVPNAGDTSLVMWVSCELQEFRVFRAGRSTIDVITADDIKFTDM